jgi:hypothetical protein
MVKHLPTIASSVSDGMLRRNIASVALEPRPRHNKVAKIAKMREANAADCASQKRNPMKKSLMCAALIAGLAICVGETVVVTTPVAAADEGQKVSKSIAKTLSEAQKALEAKDWATAIAKCKEAQSAPDLKDFDKYIINRFLGMAYLSSGDTKDATTAIEAAADSPALPEGDRQSVLRAAIGLANEATDYPNVIKYGEMAEKANAVDDSIAATMAIAYFNSNDTTNAVKYAQRALDLYKAAGKTPERSIYQVIVMSQNRNKDYAGEAKTFEKMVVDYGNPEDWGHLIDLSMVSLSTANKAYRNIAALDMYRLSMTVGATAAAEDYMAMADAAQSINSSGDVENALRTGIAKGKLSEAKVAGELRKAELDSKRDQAVLAQAEAAAAKNPSGKEDMSVAEDYYGYGRYADAARVAQRAAAKGGATASEARLLLGMSQAMQGDNTTAVQTLAGVDGDPSMMNAAHLWSLYASRKYGTTQAAAPAAGK